MVRTVYLLCGSTRLSMAHIYIYICTLYVLTSCTHDGTKVVESDAQNPLCVSVREGPEELNGYAVAHVAQAQCRKTVHHALLWRMVKVLKESKTSLRPSKTKCVFYKNILQINIDYTLLLVKVLVLILLCSWSSYELWRTRSAM